jgi:ketosteroid isomerase-like protein
VNGTRLLVVFASAVLVTACQDRGPVVLAPGLTQIPPARPAQSAADVEKELTQMENDLTAALVKNDIAAVTDRILADDFVTTMPDGSKATPAELKEAVKSGALKFESMSISNVKVRVFGDTAVVTYDQTEKSTDHGKDSSGNTQWMDVFVKRGGQWKMVAEQGSKPTPPK